MSKNYEDYKPLNPLPPRRRKNSFVTFTQYLVVVLLVIAIVGSAAFFVITHKNSQKASGTPQNTDASQNGGAESTNNNEKGNSADTGDTNPPENDPPAIEYKAVEVSNEALNKGALAYISDLYKAVYPTDAELIKLYGNNENAYMLSSADITVRRDMLQNLNSFIKAFNEASGKGNVVIWTGYRNADRQQKVYDDYVKRNGEAAAVGNVSKAGESDYHTGYTIGIRVKVDTGYAHPSSLEGYAWLLENCHKFGFIERYPSDKVGATGFNPDNNSLCLRYVGTLHAEIMKQKNMCLEEYLAYIKDFKFNGTHFEFTSEDGKDYGIYFVSKTTEADKTVVNVPKESVYTITGNNMDGFVVAYTK